MSTSLLLFWTSVNELAISLSYVIRFIVLLRIGSPPTNIFPNPPIIAFNIEYGFHKEAFSILEKYYEPGNFNDGRQKMAKMPVTANLILNPTSGAPGFYVEIVFSLPGVPSILKAMIGGLGNLLVGGDPILSKTINLMTYESEIASSLTDVQDNNKDVEIGSYPFFRQGKLGVSIVLRSKDQDKINLCNSLILDFVKAKNIKIVELE